MERTGGDEVEVVSDADYWVGRVKSIRRFTVRDADVRAPYKGLALDDPRSAAIIGQRSHAQDVELLWAVLAR